MQCAGFSSYTGVMFCIDGSISDMLTPTFNYTNCFTDATCVSSESDGNCSIEYGQDPSYQDLSPPIQTPLNCLITLPLLEPNTIYYYQVTIIINSSRTFQLRGSFVNRECKLIHNHCP